MKKKVFFFFASLLLSLNTNIVQADDYRNQEPLDYNIFTAESWTLSPYTYFGYAFSYSSHKNQYGYTDDTGNVHNMDYQYMLRNLHHGFKVAIGLTINKTWAFELSAWHTRRTSSINGSYLDNINFANIDSIVTATTIIGFDTYMRLPFSFYRNNVSIYLTGGMNAIVNSINKSYKDPIVNVPSWVAKDMTKTAFGLNAGIAVKYNFTQHIYLRTEIRRLWVVTSSLIRDSWIYSVGIGLNC